MSDVAQQGPKETYGSPATPSIVIVSPDVQNEPPMIRQDPLLPVLPNPGIFDDGGGHFRSYYSEQRFQRSSASDLFWPVDADRDYAARRCFRP